MWNDPNTFYTERIFTLLDNTTTLQFSHPIFTFIFILIHFFLFLLAIPFFCTIATAFLQIFNFFHQKQCANSAEKWIAKFLPYFCSFFLLT